MHRSGAHSIIHRWKNSSLGFSIYQNLTWPCCRCHDQSWTEFKVRHNIYWILLLLEYFLEYFFTYQIALLFFRKPGLSFSRIKVFFDRLVERNDKFKSKSYIQLYEVGELFNVSFNPFYHLYVCFLPGAQEVTLSVCLSVCDILIS